MIKFKKFDPDFFKFSKAERLGIYLLLGLSAFLMVFRYALPVFNKPEKDTDPIIIQNFKAWSDSLAEAETIKESEVSEMKIAVRFTFDPNTASEEDLLRLGFKPWLAKNLLKYRSKGGRFSKPDDLKKLYGISEEFYNEIEPYVAIAETNPSKNQSHEKDSTPHEKVVKPSKILEINTADTNDLKRLPGIGSVLANRIVSYRNSLGGFYQLEQLGEVYGLNPETIERNMPLLSLDTSIIVKISINQADLSTLTRHPYFRISGIGKRIINYRNQHGAYTQFEQIKNAGQIPNDLWPKLVPYLKLD